jgi:hypothetical protein
MDSISFFYQGISEVQYNSSETFILYVIGLILVGVIICLVIFKDSLRSIVFKDDYHWYYILGVLNLVNIFSIVYYYTNHTGTYVGDVGNKGKIGKKGSRGKMLTCSLCKENLYIYKTNNYDQITILNPALENIVANEINLSEKDILKKLGTTDIDIDPVSMIEALYAEDGLLYTFFMSRFYDIFSNVTKYLNSYIVGSKNNSYGSYFRPMAKDSYYAMGDTAFNVSKANKMNTFMISGNVRNPASFTKISHFFVPIKDSTENIVLQKFNVYKIVAQTGYVELGDIIQRASMNIDKLPFACVSENCVKILPRSSMECIFVQYSLKNVTDDIKLPDFINFITTPLNQQIMSIWRTPLNTIYFNTGLDFSNNSIAYNIINGNPEYLNDVGDIDDDKLESIKEKLSLITLTPEIRSTLIVGFYCAKILIEFPEYMFNYIESSLNKKNIKDVSDLSQNELISFAIDVTNYSITYLNKMMAIADKDVKNATSAYDIFKTMFGINMRINIAIDNDGVEKGGIPLINIQRMFLQILKVIFPPNRNVYMLKNECIAMYNVDEERLILVDKLETLISKYEFLYKQYLTNPKQQCVGYSLVRDKMDAVAKDLSKYLDSIPDWNTKLMSHDYDSFNSNRIKYIIKVYTDMNSFIMGNCSSS